MISHKELFVLLSVVICHLTPHHVHVLVVVVQQVGGFREVTWLYCDNWNIELGQLQSENISEPLNSMFGGSVDTETRVGLAGGNTGHIDQSATRDFQQRQTVFGHMKTAQDVGVDLGLNLINCLPVKLSTNTGAYNIFQ